MPASFTASIIIPAHNEELVIGNCLEKLLKDYDKNPMEVIVVCNGCSDRTAKVAAQFQQVKVIVTEKASKIHAINLGEAAAVTFPRFYLDADGQCPPETIVALTNVLNQGTKLAVAPIGTIVTKESSWLVKEFYKVKAKLPSSEAGTGGAGLYGVSKKGREKFTDFPEIIADDLFFRLQFSSDEWLTLNSLSVLVFAPKNIYSLIKINTRNYLGAKQLRDNFTRLWKNHPQSNRKAIAHLVLYPTMWLRLTLYVFVQLLSRARALLLFRKQPNIWERDDSSRLSS